MELAQVETRCATPAILNPSVAGFYSFIAFSDTSTRGSLTEGPILTL